MSWMNETAPRSTGYGLGATTFTGSWVEYDAGLRAHMIGVYNYMMLGLVLSGAVAYAVVNTSFGSLFYAGLGRLTALGWVALLAPLGLILIASFGAHRLSPTAIQGLYSGSPPSKASG
jgi:hypothetical protein